MSKEATFNKLREALMQYDEEMAVEAANEVVAQNLDVNAAAKTLSAAMSELGEKFEKMEVYLPEVVLGADAMKAAFKVLEPHIAKSGLGEKKGTVIAGTVLGDVHAVGKDMVVTYLMTQGFDVIDLGVDVSPSAFLQEAKRTNAQIIAASALMTTSRPVQKDLLDLLNFTGDRDKFKVMVGGGVVTPEWAEEIGADGTAQDALAAIEVANKLVGR